MAVEAKRGCGYRKIGGLYLVSGGAGVPCDRLPITLDVCPVCSHGFKQARGFTWVDLAGLVGGAHEGCHDQHQPCPLCTDPKSVGKCGLMWIGEKFYKTPAAFMHEGIALGFSRRIKALPRNFKVGETYILIAHPKTVRKACPVCAIHAPLMNLLNEPAACEGCGGTGEIFLPGIFTLWRPERIEKILPESKRASEEVKELIENGITPVFVPDGDKDHQGSVYDAEEEPASEEVLAAEVHTTVC